MIFQEFKNFPAELSAAEKDILFSVLPEQKPAYNAYRKFILNSFVIGAGRFGGGNFYLGAETGRPDLSIPSSSIFAAGSVESEKGKASIAIHEIDEGMLEAHVSVDENFDADKIIKRYSYSDWLPGMKAPGDGSAVREVHLIKNRLVLAFAARQKRIWAFDSQSGINYIIPITNYYNEIFRLAINKDKKTSPNITSFFDELDIFSDEILGLGFLSYNKYLNKINLDYSLFEKKEKTMKKKSVWNIFKKRKKSV